MAAERISVSIRGDSTDLQLAARAARDSIKDVRQEALRSNVAMRALGRDNDRATRSFADLGRAIGNVNKQATFFRNTVSLLKMPALITGVGLAAQALSTLAGGAVAATSALAPLTGALGALPGLATAAAQAMGVAKLATAGLSEALAGNEKALARLTPEARSFLVVLKGFKPALEDLRRRAQRGLFPGLEDGLTSAARSLPVLKRAVTDTAVVLGRLGREAGQLVGSKGFGKDLDTVLQRNVKVIDRFGRAGINLGDALRHVVVAAGPLVDWMSRTALGWGRQINAMAEAGRESGKLHAFFRETQLTMQRLGSILGNLASGFYEIGKAAAPLGKEILRSLDIVTAKFAAWTNSAEGQNSLRKYFDDIKPPLYEAARLVGAVGGAFLELGRTPGLTQLLQQVRTELVPALTDMVATTTQAFGPHLISALTQFTKLFANLAGSSGPLIVMVDALALIAKGLNAIFEQSDLVKTAVVSILALGGIAKALKITAALTGMKDLVSVAKKIGPMLGRAAGAEAAGTAAGGFAGRFPDRMKGKAGTWKSVGKSLGLVLGVAVAAAAGTAIGNELGKVARDFIKNHLDPILEKIGLAKKASDVIPGFYRLPDELRFDPNAPRDPIGGRRAGGRVGFNTGGLVPAAVSPGELLVGPGGGRRWCPVRGWRPTAYGLRWRPGRWCSPTTGSRCSLRGRRSRRRSARSCRTSRPAGQLRRSPRRAPGRCRDATRPRPASRSTATARAVAGAPARSATATSASAATGSAPPCSARS